MTFYFEFDHKTLVILQTARLRHAISQTDRQPTIISRSWRWSLATSRTGLPIPKLANKIKKKLTTSEIVKFRHWPQNIDFFIQTIFDKGDS